MASRPRSRKKRGWPDGLYERGGYYSWRNPMTGKEVGIGRVTEGDAKAQASEANIAIAGLRDKPRLVDRVLGKSDGTFGAWLTEYETLLKDRELADNTRKAYKSNVKKIREVYKLSLALPLDKITTKIVAAGLTTLKRSMQRTAQAIRSRLVDVFDTAMAEGWTASNPVTVTDEVSVKVKRARLTWDVFKAAYDRTKVTSTRNAAALAIVSGQPREVLAAALFTQVGPVSRPGMAPIECWRFERGKTKALIAIPLDIRLNVFGLSLREVIAQCRGTGVLSKFMVHNVERRKGAKLGAPIALNRMSKDYTAEITALGLDWGDAAPPTLHEIRSLSKRLYKAQGGVNTKDLLGHKTEQMDELYSDARGTEYKLVGLG